MGGQQHPRKKKTKQLQPQRPTFFPQPISPTQFSLGILLNQLLIAITILFEFHRQPSSQSIHPHHQFTSIDARSLLRSLHHPIHLASSVVRHLSAQTLNDQSTPPRRAFFYSAWLDFFSHPIYPPHLVDAPQLALLG
ncbi:hypothetical protein PGT21_013808 [Puccinia graminis f. sp. tritici]|uniref:Uncharacterized protein n=1 Tax=Puccinia graminis f. sp. tritici TaxID=56615 RepID=A0A5B0MPP3_PUCGR|nr:hypothetical protein PGTUg99_008273 [Puccinia graminis f. sp. tritici]KAA1078987.1 hypothetical protein PGTUg99_018681 [Puccinia graminis f. sp. tritici]KAA1090734.1 hypothetical protein PGT21_012038 [Puccinia graminis f. sp. tritici]KAA1110193.1 hypothetical protein PGT21_013808 [Puccinia graminis f. sp. tritici]